MPHTTLYVTTKKLSEETEQNPSESQPHWSNNILGSPSLSNPFWSISVRGHSHIQVATRNVQWTFMGGYLNYMYVFVCGNCLAKTYCFLPSIGQLTMPNFFFCQIYVCNGTNKRIQHTEFSFLPVSKALKAVSCITDFGVSTAIITFFVGGASWTLDSSMEATNCKTKLTKKFISVAA